MSNWVLIGLMLGAAACGVAIGLSIGMRLCWHISHNMSALVGQARQIVQEFRKALDIDGVDTEEADEE